MTSVLILLSEFDRASYYIENDGSGATAQILFATLTPGIRLINADNGAIA